MTSFGACFHRTQDPAGIAEEASAVERLGFDELWVIEDCFYTSAPALAAAALTATTDITVGIGIVPSVARNAAVTAMEFGTLARMGPGRFHGGIGHGVQSWMGEMGARVGSPLTALRETITAVRSLLAGETLTVNGRYVHLDQVSLEVAPDPVPPVSAGVTGEKSLALAGEVADGTIFVELTGVDYLTWARDRLGAGAGHALTVLAAMSVDRDGDEARRVMVPFVVERFQLGGQVVQALPFYQEVAAKAERSGWTDAVAAMPPRYWSQIGPIGNPDEAASYLTAVAAAGADSLCMFPHPEDPIAHLERFAREVLATIR